MLLQYNTKRQSLDSLCLEHRYAITMELYINHEDCLFVVYKFSDLYNWIKTIISN